METIDNTADVAATQGEAVIRLQEPAHAEYYHHVTNPSGYVMLTTRNVADGQREVQIFTNMDLSIAAKFILTVFNKLVTSLARAGVNI